MATELLLRYADLAALKADFESNLQKGRAFVPGASGLSERAFCTLHIEHPSDAARLSLRAASSSARPWHVKAPCPSAWPSSGATAARSGRGCSTIRS